MGHRGRTLTLAFLAGLLWWARALPSPLFSDPVSLLLLSGSGELLGARIAADGQWRFPAAASVPPRFAAALIRAEDKRFRSHPGVDPLALVRAAADGLASRRVVSGASTLTMQTLRLARKGRPRTLREKLVELALAPRLELRLSKDEILALYASHAPFGGNVVGLEAAAWRYFGRPSGTLSWSESCLLAVLPNDPASIHPGRNRDALRRKRDALIRALEADGTLGAMEADLAVREPLPGPPRPLPRLAPRLLDTLAPGAKTKPPRTRDHILRTTLDAGLQRSVSAIVRRRSAALRGSGIENAAALVIDNRTFEVLAYVGNTGGGGPASGSAIDLVGRPRSTGSLLKPFLYAAMLDEGLLLPETLVPDLPTRLEGFAPENYDRSYRGAVRARDALARSLNVPAVRMLKDYGVHRFHDFLRSAGMTTLHRPAGDYGLALILGGAEGTLWELAALYANLARAASAPPSWDAARRLPVVLAGADPKTAAPAPFGAGAAWLTLEALSDTRRPSGDSGWKNYAGGRRIAWKTGTSHGHRDAWAVGSDARHTVGVWAGNASGSGNPDLIGATTAAPILFDIFNRLGPGGWFPEPWDALGEAAVCADDGFLPRNGCPTARVKAPKGARFSRLSPNHRFVHLDASGTRRVHAGCARVTEMRHASWFVLPPGQEYFFKKVHPDYRVLPPYKDGCEPSASAAGGPIAFLYPGPRTEIYIPTELDGTRGRVVFEAAHRRDRAVLYWHLDGEYIGPTETFHQLALDVPAGKHELTVVDERGASRSRRFSVID